MFYDVLILGETFLWISFGHITFQTGDVPPDLPCLPGLVDLHTVLQIPDTLNSPRNLLGMGH